MATIQQENEVRGQLQESLQKISEIDAKKLERTEELGRLFSFEDLAPVFEKTLRLFANLKSISFDDFSHGVMSGVLDQTNDALEKLKQIQTFNPEEHEQNPKGVRDSFVNQLRDSYDSYFSVIYPIIAYGSKKGEDFVTLQKKAEETVDSLDDMRVDFKKREAQIISEMESVLDRARDAAGKVGVAKYAAHFKDEAEEHEAKSKKWLGATIALTAVTSLWGIASFFIHPEKGYNSWFQIMQYTIPKFIILSVLFYALVWAARNYNANRHNYVVNKHRQNSLSTFEAFVAAAGDDMDTKNAVLLQATQSIFSAQATGYVLREGDMESPHKIVEVFRSAASTTQKSE